MPCEQLVPTDRGLVTVSLVGENPRENVALAPVRGQERHGKHKGELGEA